MKFAAVKKIAAIFFTVICIFSLTFNSYAETIQDSLEQRLEELQNQFNSSDGATQNSISDILESAGLGDIDFGSLGETDIGQIIGGLGNNLAADDLLGLMEDAISSGSDMINDVINGGLGTSDGSNTATTKPAVQGGSPNIIIANPNPVQGTNAVGVPQLTTKAPSTKAPESTTAADIVGAGVTTPGTTAPQVAVDDAMSTSTVAVLVVLSVATIAVIVAIVIFFVMKKK
ncbi:MAG: hypothetical protein IKW03_04330 [Clostridia bacterium]|nr:hypothetical protein [Clostridia bacterium]